MNDKRTNDERAADERAGLSPSAMLAKIDTMQAELAETKARLLAALGERKGGELKAAALEEGGERESRLGWNNTCVQVGDVVRVRKPGFGRHCMAEVLAFPDGHPKHGQAMVRIVKASAKTSWRTGNRVEIFCGFLEGGPMH